MPVCERSDSSKGHRIFVVWQINRTWKLLKDPCFYEQGMCPILPKTMRHALATIGSLCVVG